jgi:hypothetical protein
MATSANFADLPVEMIERIAECAGNDMKILRLVSRHVAAVSLKAYKAHFFSDLKVFLATESSLRKAIEVVDSPGLGAAVKRLVLVDDGFLELDEPYSRSKDRAAQEQFHDEEGDRVLLTELFKKCGQRGTGSTVHFRSFIEGIEGPPRVWKYNPHNIESNQHGFMTTMHAVALSGASFKTFIMDAVPVNKSDTNIFTGIPILQPSRSRFQTNHTTCVAAMRRFQTLHLVLEAGVGFPMELLGYNFLSAIHNNRVRSLKIKPDFETQYAAIYCSKIATMTVWHHIFPTLELLTLRFVKVDWEELVGFLKRQKCLQKLVMCGVELSGTPTGLHWPDLQGLTWSGGENDTGKDKNVFQALSEESKVASVVDGCKNGPRTFT